MRKSQNHYFGLPSPDLEHILALAQADLEALRGKKLFITGGTGFFGKWLLGGLLCANDELDWGLSLTVLSRNPALFQRQFPETNRDDLRFLTGHVADFPIDHRRFDFLLHAAADTTATDETERTRAIVEGTRRMLELAKISGAERMLHISSGAVYGAASGKLSGASETDYEAAQALMPYGEAKRRSEDLCAESGIDFVTARAFAFLGPHLPLDAHFAAGNFLRDALRGGPIQVRGDGTAMRSYLHPADLVVWLLRLLIRGQRGQAYNVGSDEAVTTAQLAHLIAEAVTPKADVVIQSLQPQGPQNIYLPNISRARGELNLGVAISLRDATTRTLTFHLRG